MWGGIDLAQCISTWYRQKEKTIMCFQERILTDVVIYICERTIQAHPVAKKSHKNLLLDFHPWMCCFLCVFDLSFVVITDECKVLIPTG